MLRPLADGHGRPKKKAELNQKERHVLREQKTKADHLKRNPHLRGSRRIGLEKDDLFERLHDEIEQARIFYSFRVDPALPGAARIFNFALVDVLVARNRRVSTFIW